MVLAPVAVGTGLVERAGDVTDSSDESTSGHIDGLWRGIDALIAEPLGRGLGTSAGVGQRFGGAPAVITENYYLQVGVEMGVAATALFALLVFAIARGLTRESEHGGDEIAGARGAFIGLAVGALLLHVWIDIAVSWTAWGVAGALLGITERSRGAPAGSAARHADEPAPAMMVATRSP